MLSLFRSRRPRNSRNEKRKNHCRPRLEALEDRVVPAFNLALVNNAATLNVTPMTDASGTTFTATGAGATLNVADVLTALNAGDVVVDSGSTGAEAGNITVNADLAYTDPAAHSLTLQTGSGTGVVGNIDLNAALTSTGAVTVKAGAATAAGTSVTVTLGDAFAVTAGTDVSIVGRAGEDDTLHGPNIGTTFTITGSGSGSGRKANIEKPGAFHEVENPGGGGGNDRFGPGSSTAFIQSIDGGDGIDTLDVGHSGGVINVTGPSSSGFSGSVPGFVDSFTNIDTQGAIVFAIPIKRGAPDLPPDDDPEDPNDP